jgi:hypothetical protein
MAAGVAQIDSAGDYRRPLPGDCLSFQETRKPFSAALPGLVCPRFPALPGSAPIPQPNAISGLN